MSYIVDNYAIVLASITNFPMDMSFVYNMRHENFEILLVRDSSKHVGSHIIHHFNFISFFFLQ